MKNYSIGVIGKGFVGSAVAMDFQNLPDGTLRYEFMTKINQKV